MSEKILENFEILESNTNDKFIFDELMKKKMFLFEVPKNVWIIFKIYSKNLFISLILIYWMILLWI